MSRKRPAKNEMKVERSESSAASKQGAGAKSDAPTKSPTLSPLLVLLSAPSGGGKTTLCQQLLAARPDMTRAVTCTTREPRPGEKDTVDLDEIITALAKTVAEMTFGSDAAVRQRILEDLVREISQFEAEYASAPGSDMRH